MHRLGCLLRPLAGALSLGIVGHSGAAVLCEQVGALASRKASTATVPWAVGIAPPRQGAYDVAIVGGGIVGLATAREIIGRYPHMTVTVLEKVRRLQCSGTPPQDLMACSCLRRAGLPLLRVRVENAIFHDWPVLL